MSRIGKIFQTQSLQIDRAEIAKIAGGEYEKINLACFLFIYRQFCDHRKTGVHKIQLSWQTAKGCPVIELRPIHDGEKVLQQLSTSIEKYHQHPLAAFFVWQRSNKEKIRKVPYHQVWEFNRNNKKKEIIRIPVDEKYASNFNRKKSSKMYISLLTWVPHIIEGNTISVDLKDYPFYEDWQKHKVYLEWTRQLKLPPIAQPKNSIIIEELIDELGPDFEKKIELLTNRLRKDIQNQFSQKVCVLLEMLSASLYRQSSMSLEQKLKAISLGIFGE